MKRFWLLLMCLILLPNMATAWWNDDWGYKKKITLDKQKLQQSGETIPGDALLWCVCIPAILRILLNWLSRAKIFGYWRVMRKLP